LEPLLRLALGFVYPLGFSLLMAVIALALSLLGRRHDSAIAIGLLISVLWLSSTRGVASLLIHSLEGENPYLGVDATPRADAIIVLGGALSMPLDPSQQANLVSASDRILHTARLYRAGKAPLVIVSGGTNPRWGGLAEGPFTARLLVEWGVSPGDIQIESVSTTTYENARESARIVRERKLGSVLLVTSALHMPRSLLTFRSAGIDAIPAATDHQNEPGHLGSLGTWLPRTGALDQTTRALHEYIGMLYYRWHGWIRQ
jgi:uncharacterized SAM-binding protein YcdF (DUF218 family)